MRAKLCWALALLSMGCETDDGAARCDAPDARPSCTSAAPSYEHEIIPILEAKCNNCHDGTQGLWPLTDYQSVVDWMAIIEEDLLACTMPPTDSPQLTAGETDALLLWLACGAPRAQPDASNPVIGQPCVPNSEQQPAFQGGAVSEVGLDTSATCGDGVCLSNHFQGRVSCPYGQSATELESLPADAPARCRVPDASGTPTSAAVTTAVAPQLLDRRADEVVTCSCRCDGPTPSPDYCTCPAGTQCTLLVEDFAPGTGDSYCIKVGTAYDPAAAAGSTCDKASADSASHCGGGDARGNP